MAKIDEKAKELAEQYRSFHEELRAKKKSWMI